MHIKSMIIEGFKSYGRRVEIHGFDKEFNAVTGLNGTGKSNILDAICFVLGIHNLSQVRATNLQDLVYKSGQAGVTKASVTIIFDNRDRDNSPYGYEEHEEITITRQVVIGGTNKYLINGSNAQAKRVADLFGSVQLNVNNPHFLIMQGRITKVLNMKPVEILSMIEEAAGTRMYETKKLSAESTIQKKDAKLKEIDSVISNEITPKLSKLKAERQQFMDYNKVQRELDYLTKIYVAWCYLKAKESCEKSEEEVEKVLQNKQELIEAIEDGTREIKNTEKVIEELQRRKDSEGSGKLEELEKQLKDKDKRLAKLTAEEKSVKESIGDEKKKITQTEKSIKEDEAGLKAKEAELSKFQAEFQRLKDKEKADQEALKKAQQKYQDVCSGLFATDDGSDAATLEDQLMHAREEVTKADTEVKQCEMQLVHSKRELKEKESQMQRTAKDYEKDMKTLKEKEQQVKKLEAELAKIDYEDGELERLVEAKRELTAECRRYQDAIYNFEAKNPNFSFRYTDPEPNFNRLRVKGLVCKLLTVRRKETSIALQVSAGGRLYNIVSDTEQTGKLLLERGNLVRRSTIIPLNKIQSRPIDNRTIQRAKSLVGADNVESALSLIEYDPELRPAMESIFGNVLICKDMSTARRIAFHPEIMKKCVTLEGDEVNPAGTLTGGSMDRGPSVFDQLETLKTSEAKYNEKKRELDEVDRRINSIRRIAERYEQLKQQLQLSKHDLELVHQRIQDTTHHQLMQEVEQLRQAITNFENKQRDCKKIIKDGDAKIKDIENKKKNAKQIRAQQLKNAEDSMNKLKKQAEESSNNWKKREQDYNQLTMEIEALKSGIENSREQLVQIREVLTELDGKWKEAKEAVEEAKAELKRVQDEVKAQKDVINQKTKEIQEAHEKNEEIAKKIEEMRLKFKEIEYEIEKAKKEKTDNEKKVVDLEAKYEWIEAEKNYFGQAGGMYDFTETNPKEAGRRIAKLTETKEKLGRTLNTRAMAMLGKEEEQYDDLMKKKRIVENDRAKIFDVIKELDEKKKQALDQACRRVNEDFGKIFSTLLPGAKAKLQPPPGQNLLDGVEVKVGFGEVWKESLTELSGGQRSLVALSLILAMLKFKPAPIYILDEVDAALDLSHTQNIGNMLKTHFTQSQFIVVSLKDGMFNNANVLFRTKFVDGMSTVTRNVQRPTSSNQIQAPGSVQRGNKNRR